MKIHDTPASSKFSGVAFLTAKNPFLSSVLMHERELGTVHLLKNFTNNKWYERVFGELPTGQSLTAVFNKYVVSLVLYQQSFFAKKNAARLHKGFLLATFFTFKYTYLCLEDKYLSRFSCSTLIEDSKFFCQFIHDCLQQDYSSSEGQNQEFDLTKDQYQAIIDKVNYLLENYTSVFTNGLDTVYLKQLVRGAAAKYRSSMFRSRLEDMALLQSTSASDDGCDPPDVSLQSVIPESVKANVQSSHKCAGGSEQKSRMKWFIACLCSCSCIKEKSVFDKLEGYNLRMLLQIQYGSHAKIVLPPVLYLMLISICYSNSAFANVDASLWFFSTLVGVVFSGLFGKMYAQSANPAPAGEKGEAHTRPGNTDASVQPPEAQSFSVTEPESDEEARSNLIENYFACKK